MLRLNRTLSEEAMSFGEVLLVTHPCLTLCNPMDCSSQDFSVHEILQARILEWDAFSFSKRCSKPGSPTLQTDSLLSEATGKQVLERTELNTLL